MVSLCIEKDFLSLGLLNIAPFAYFAVAFQSIGGLIGDQISTDLGYGISQILSIGLLSLSVFAFYQFYLGFVTWKPCGTSLFYTQHELKKLRKKRAFYQHSRYHIKAGFLYLVIAWLSIILIVLLRAIGFFT